MLTDGRSGKPHSTRDGSDKKEFSEVDDPKQGKINNNKYRSIIRARVISV